MSATSFVPVPCSQIAPSSISWLWEPYLARGKLSVIDGDPGTGKSFVTIDLAARISAAARPSPAADRRRHPASVLLLSAEDDARDTICPRLLAANSNPAQIGILAAPGLEMDRLPQLPQDLDALEEAIRITHAALVVIDPLMAFLPSAVSANNDQSIRAALSPLAATRRGKRALAILLVRHLRKSGGANAIYRGSGSIGIMGAVRTGLMIARHPDDAGAPRHDDLQDEHRPAGLLAGVSARAERNDGTDRQSSGPAGSTSPPTTSSEPACRCEPFRERASARWNGFAAFWPRANGERRRSRRRPPRRASPSAR